MSAGRIRHGITAICAECWGRGVPCAHNGLTRAEWDACEDPALLLAHLERAGVPLRLAALACGVRYRDGLDVHGAIAQVWFRAAVDARTAMATTDKQGRTTTWEQCADAYQLAKSTEQKRLCAMLRAAIAFRPAAQSK